MLPSPALLLHSLVTGTNNKLSILSRTLLFNKCHATWHSVLSWSSYHSSLLGRSVFVLKLHSSEYENQDTAGKDWIRCEWCTEKPDWQMLEAEQGKKQDRKERLPGSPPLSLLLHFYCLLHAPSLSPSLHLTQASTSHVLLILLESSSLGPLKWPTNGIRRHHASSKMT